MNKTETKIFSFRLNVEKIKKIKAAAIKNESRIQALSATAILGSALSSASQYTNATTINGTTAAQLVPTKNMNNVQ